MRKLGIIAVLSLMVMALAAVPALAASPHFLRSSAAINNSGDLVVSFKEAGLGNITAANYTITGDVTATYACINGGTKHPQAANKEDVATTFDVSDTFPVRNGSSTGTLTSEVPESTLDCPPGQTEVLASVTYSNILLTSNFSGNTVDLGPVSREFVAI
jgi:hypothetical protein